MFLTIIQENFPLKFKSKIHRSMVRPVAMYGTQSWSSTVTDEHSMETTRTRMEMRMQRWAYGVTLYDRLRSENIRVAIGVAPLSGKIREARLRWYGHVRRADSCSVAGIAFNLRIPGPKPVGRPKTRCTDAVRRDLRTLGLAPDTDLFRDRRLWRRTIHCADPCFIAGSTA